MNVRVAAAKIIVSILHDEGSLSTLLPQYLAKVEERDRGLLQQLCYGTLRYYPRLKAYLDRLLDRQAEWSTCTSTGLSPRPGNSQSVGRARRQ